MSEHRTRSDSYVGRFDARGLHLDDIEAVRVLLSGASVVDWHHLDFRNYGGVDRFLRVNEFSPDSDHDMARLESIRTRAVDYLRHHFEFEFPPAIAIDLPARDLFLVASKSGPHQTWACVILKVMHLIHHLAGRELANHLSIPYDKMYQAIELKVMRVIEELRSEGYPIIEFEWSRKTLDSLISKLLSKPSTLAANIYDRLRFRMIVREQSHLLPVMSALHQRLIPFNYVVPGESVNHLIPFSELEAQEEHSELRVLEDDALQKEQVRTAELPINEFSAPNYKIINFVADLPIRVERLGAQAHREFGHVVFVLTEFQVADKQTSITNELGDNSHTAYKLRQRDRVRKRLIRGQKSSTLKLRRS